LVIKVKDTGPGITESDISNLFNPFVQTETGEKEQEGTGLGLSISQNFAQLLEGRITVTSEAGKGSIFTLDVAVEEAGTTWIQGQGTNRRAVMVKPGQTKYRILVIEDRPEGRDVLTSLLEKIGFEVFAADNGRTGVDSFNKYQPHLVFMDIRMPEMNGLEATRLIKAGHEAKNIPIIAVTASVFEESIEEINSSGCDALIRKPFSEAQVIEALERFLDVEFIYEELDARKKVAFAGYEHLEPLTHERLLELPPAIIEELRECYIQLNPKQLKHQIEKIRALGKDSIANSLQQIVDNFQFDKLGALLKKQN